MRSIFIRSQSSCSKVGQDDCGEEVEAGSCSPAHRRTRCGVGARATARLAAMTLAAFEMPAASYSPAPSLSISSVTLAKPTASALSVQAPWSNATRTLTSGISWFSTTLTSTPFERDAVWASGSWKARGASGSGVCVRHEVSATSPVLGTQPAARRDTISVVITRITSPLLQRPSPARYATPRVPNRVHRVPRRLRPYSRS